MDGHSEQDTEKLIRSSFHLIFHDHIKKALAYRLLLFVFLHEKDVWHCDGLFQILRHISHEKQFTNASENDFLENTRIIFVSFTNYGDEMMDQLPGFYPLTIADEVFWQYETL